MFRAACEHARNFTWPVVISRRTIGGECSSGIGTIVIINDEGWFITAAHIMQLLVDMTVQEANTRSLRDSIAAINNDSKLNNKERRRKLAQIGHLQSDAIDRWSVWWGMDDIKAAPDPSTMLLPVDIAIGRLASFGSVTINTFPRFRKPQKEFEQGASLCRIGFPFWDMKPVWNDVNNAFNLTQIMPLPLFANEGILARMSQTILVDETGKPLPNLYPFKCIETSNAGILGQSGGPIFDQKGVIWGIQTSTVSYELDLKTEGKQYYNVGVGCHAETIIGFLTQHNIKHEIDEAEVRHGTH
jgi:hypothetical protein